MSKEGYGKAILAATTIAIISAASASAHFRRHRKLKQLPSDHFLAPSLKRNDSSGRSARLENFSDYVARQIGFEDASECPGLCKLAYEYLKKSKSYEGSIYEYFANDENADELYVKLVEEFERCILSYFSFHWSQASLIITQFTVNSYRDWVQEERVRERVDDGRIEEK